jgi:hypothetical protein
MGLDINAYRQVRKSPTGDACADVNPDFPEQADGITSGNYDYKERHSFRAGSYGHYSEWRNELAVLAGWESAERCRQFAAGVYGVTPPDGSPFLPLISFSDCEGVIGPLTSARLLADFNKFKEVAAQRPRWFFDLYMEFSKAFEIAADGGFVEFS